MEANMPGRNTSPRLPQRGAAALIVVVVLFFILALVTAYAGRNLIFEQRTSINNQRATQAFEVAEAGLEFAIGLLSSGRVDDACQPTNVTTQATFRERQLTLNMVNGNFSLSGGQADLRPTCVILANGPSCSCPAAGAPNLVEPVGLAPAIQLRFEAGLAQPGLVRVTSRGCSSIGTQCYAASARGPADAVAETSVLLGLNSALASPPKAALTARGAVDLGPDAVTVSNTDVSTHGITINAGGPVSYTVAARITSAPGSPGGTASIRAEDKSFRDSADNPWTGNRMFVSLFGMDRATYRSQPGAIRIVCSGDCSTAILAAASANPNRVIWVQGPVTISSETTLGAPGAPPVMLVVQGNLTVAANLQLTGVLYLHDPSGSNVWNTNAGSTMVDGAVVAEGNLSITGAPTISFNPNVLRTINTTQGSLVRVPGSWRDFAAGS
jgi:Tfp pilus assembly protein PilX